MVLANEHFQAAIIANGSFPENEAAQKILRQVQHIVCCDGAFDKAMAHGYTPTAIVGDCDSMKSEDLQLYADLIHPDKSEAYNDLQKALKYCIQLGLDHIALLGCDGLRDDHFIANISIMATYSERLGLVMLTNNGIFHVIHHTAQLEATPGQQVSIFCKDENLPLTFHGLKYPVTKRCFKYFWEGSLNEVAETPFTIETHGSGTVLVYFPF